MSSIGPTGIRINGQQADTTGIKNGKVKEIQAKIGGRILPPTNPIVPPTITKTSDLPPPPEIISTFDPLSLPPTDIPPPCPDLPAPLPNAVHQKSRPLPQPGVVKKPATKPGALSTADQKTKNGVNQGAANTPPKQVLQGSSKAGNVNIQGNEDLLIAEHYGIASELQNNVNFRNIKFEQTDQKNSAQSFIEGYDYNKDGDYWYDPKTGDLITRDTYNEIARACMPEPSPSSVQKVPTKPGVDQKPKVSAQPIQQPQKQNKKPTIDLVGEELKKQGYDHVDGNLYFNASKDELISSDDITKAIVAETVAEIVQEVNAIATSLGYFYDPSKGGLRLAGVYTNDQGQSMTLMELYDQYVPKNPIN